MNALIHIRMSKSINSFIYIREYSFYQRNIFSSFFVMRIKFIFTFNKSSNISKYFIVHIERLFSTVFVGSQNIQMIIKNITNFTKLIELFKSNIIMNKSFSFIHFVFQTTSIFSLINNRMSSITITCSNIITIKFFKS